MSDTFTSEQMRVTASVLAEDRLKNHDVVITDAVGELRSYSTRQISEMLSQAADTTDKNAVVVELLEKLTDYIERSCDEWYADYPNSGDSDMAFQRMMNFRMDAHEILKKLGIYDEIADNNRSIKRLQDFWWKYDGNKKKQSMLKKQIEFLKDRNKKVAEERSERK